MKKFKGFTLIELLVVIAIIGILASMVLVALSGARAKARDATRKSDLRQIKTALEVYYSDKNPNYYLYSVGADANSTSTGLDTTYIKTFPTDPLGTVAPYQYKTDGDATDNGQNYGLYAKLENGNDGEINTADPLGGTMPTGYNYSQTND